MVVLHLITNFVPSTDFFKVIEGVEINLRLLFLTCYL